LKKSIRKNIWAFFRTLLLVSIGFIVMYPLIYMVSCTFRERSDMNDPTVVWIPKHFTLDILKETAEATDFANTLTNTLILNIGCSAVQVLSCSFTGYGFARFNFKGKKVLFAVVIMMILVPVQVISLPLYSQFRFFFGINLIDTMWTMYLPAITANGISSGLMILVFRQFFRGLPKELEDASYIDGCGPFGTFVRIILPNSVSTIITVFLFSAVFYWNDYYINSMFFSSTKTFSFMLANLESELNLKLFNSATVQISPREQTVWKEAGCLMSVTPILIIYIFLQRYFTEGIERSGLAT